MLNMLHKIFLNWRFWMTSIRSTALLTRKVCMFITRNVCGYMWGQYVTGNRTGKSTRIARSNLVGISAKFGPEARHRAHERTCLLVLPPFSKSLSLSMSYFSPGWFRIACLKHESDIIARRAILPHSYGTVRKGTPRSMTARQTRWTLMIAPAC